MASGFIIDDVQLLNVLRSPKQIDEGIRYLYKEYFHYLGSYVTHHGGSTQDAEDIIQEVMVSFISVVDKGLFRGESSIKTFLYSMVRHAWANELKKRDRRSLREMKYEKENEKSSEDLDMLMQYDEYRKSLMDVINKLDDICRKILVAFYYDELSMKEILELVPYENEQVVRNKKSKCLKGLESLLVQLPGFNLKK